MFLQRGYHLSLINKHRDQILNDRKAKITLILGKGLQYAISQGITSTHFVRSVVLTYNKDSYVVMNNMNKYCDIFRHDKELNPITEEKIIFVYKWASNIKGKLEICPKAPQTKQYCIGMGPTSHSLCKMPIYLQQGVYLL